MNMLPAALVTDIFTAIDAGAFERLRDSDMGVESSDHHALAAGGRISAHNSYHHIKAV